MEFEYPNVADDLKYVCRLSTILVATIQEVKDRVSQIELIFCSQLFPSFQSRSKHLERRFDDAKKAAEDGWKRKESSLLNQIEQLVLEKKNSEMKIEQLSTILEQTETRLMNAEQLVKENEIEKQQLMHKLESQVKNEEMICQLKNKLEQKSTGLEEEKESRKRLLEDNEVKVQNLLMEQSKRKELFDDYNKLKRSYKQLKSQYLFLVRKLSGNFGHEHSIDRTEQEEDSPSSHQNKRNLQHSEETDLETLKYASKLSDLRTGIVSDKKLEVHPVNRPVKRLSADSHINSSSSAGPLPIKHNSGGIKSETEPKVRGSLWRDTRTCQNLEGGDPHDDFLDTPMEIVKNFNKGQCEEAQDIPSAPPQDMDPNNSDDETQDINIKIIPKPQHLLIHDKSHDQSTKNIPKPQNISILGPANKGFKYIGPVRKKAERENLKGVQCLQCKKFYDAVLPDGGGEGNNSTDFFCEHHDGVSRHRYRYAPPMTPEGFWNIGFESEI